MEEPAFLNAIAAAPKDEAPKKIYADWLNERGRDKEAELYRNWTPAFCLPEINDGNWSETFGYADGTAILADEKDRPQKAAPHLDVSEAPFSICDVVEIIAMREGEHDESNWIAVGRLFDGRWFAIDAGCDYTGWD